MDEKRLTDDEIPITAGHESGEAVDAEDRDRRKKKLSLDGQIKHLESKGVQFKLCSKDRAAEYLADRNYLFKLASYRKLFDKYVGGMNDGLYISLDFEHLRTLASLDQGMRELLLPMTLDVEHFVKTDLVRRLTENEEEDGYTLVLDYYDSLSEKGKSYLAGEFKSRVSDEYCGAVIGKYEHEMPLWAFVESVSFGTIVDLVRFCAERWKDDRMLGMHYLLKDVKAVRNAAAHGSCILNGFDCSRSKGIRPSPVLSKAVARAGASKPVRAKMLANNRIRQISTVFYVYSVVAPAGKSRERRLSKLGELLEDARALDLILPENHAAVSVFAFLRKLTSGFGLL